MSFFFVEMCLILCHQYLLLQKQTIHIFSAIYVAMSTIHIFSAIYVAMSTIHIFSAIYVAMSINYDHHT